MAWIERAGACALLAYAACSGPARGPGQNAGNTLRIEALDGGVIDTARYLGKPVVLHLFTTWSLAAQGDVAELKSAHEEFGDAVVIIGIALDPDGYRLVAPWRRVSEIDYLIALASPAIMAGNTFLGRITQVPTTVIVGPGGQVAHRLSRPLAPGELHQLLTRLAGSPVIQ